MQLPSLYGIENALGLIRPYHLETPLVRSESLSRAFNAEVWLKIETVSPVASFKLRGALTEILRSQASGAISGVVTSSTGNHGQGVAYAARLVGVPSNIFLPVDGNSLKAEAIRMFGGKVHMVGAEVDGATKMAAQVFARENGHTFVDDGEGLGVMEGAGTVGLEIARGLKGVDKVFVPMGSGSLAAGCAAALKALQPKTWVIAVQSEKAPAMFKSFHQRSPVEWPIEPGIVADGLAGRKPARLALAAILKFMDDVVLVSDADVLAGVHTLAMNAHVLVEPSGAAAFAAAWRLRETVKDQRIVLVLSGANLTMDMLKRAISVDPFFQPSALAHNQQHMSSVKESCASQ